jgi:hypothetical protein
MGLIERQDSNFDTISTAEMMQVQEHSGSQTNLAFTGGLMCAAGLVVLVAIGTQKRRGGYHSIDEQDHV